MAENTCYRHAIRPEEVDTKAIQQGYTLAFDEPFPTESDYPEEQEDSTAWDEYWNWSPLAYGI